MPRVPAPIVPVHLFLRFTSIFIFCTCVSVCEHVCISFVCLLAVEAKEAIQSPETGAIGGCESPCGCWGRNPGPLHEYQVLFTAELSPASPLFLYCLSALQSHRCLCCCLLNVCLSHWAYSLMCPQSCPPSSVSLKPDMPKKSINVCTLNRPQRLTNCTSLGGKHLELRFEWQQWGIWTVTVTVFQSLPLWMDSGPSAALFRSEGLGENS